MVLVLIITNRSPSGAAPQRCSRSSLICSCYLAIKVNHCDREMKRLLIWVRLQPSCKWLGRFFFRRRRELRILPGFFLQKLFARCLKMFAEDFSGSGWSLFSRGSNNDGQAKDSPTCNCTRAQSTKRQRLVKGDQARGLSSASPGERGWLAGGRRGLATGARQRNSRLFTFRLQPPFCFAFFPPSFPALPPHPPKRTSAALWDARH